MKLTLVILAVFLASLSFVNAQENVIYNATDTSDLINIGVISQCFPEYICDEWSKCSNFLQTRTCKDKKCNVRDVREVRFCDLKESTCQPDVYCWEWSDCNYEEDLSGLADGKISFGGFRTRVCGDTNGCVENFIEESLCQEQIDLQLLIKKECDKEFLVANNLVTHKQLAKIDLESFEQSKLDIVLSQSETAYCSSCYNGLVDRNEKEIDCGGDCKPCKQIEFSFFPLQLVEIIFWILTSLFFLLSLNELKV